MNDGKLFDILNVINLATKDLADSKESELSINRIGLKCLLNQFIVNNIAYLAGMCSKEELDSISPIQNTVNGDMTVREWLMNLLANMFVGEDFVLDYVRKETIQKLRTETTSEKSLDMTYVKMVTQKILSQKCRLAGNVTKQALQLAKERKDPAYDAIIENRVEYARRAQEFINNNSVYGCAGETIYPTKKTTQMLQRLRINNSLQKDVSK